MPVLDIYAMEVQTDDYIYIGDYLYCIETVHPIIKHHLSFDMSVVSEDHLSVNGKCSLKLHKYSLVRIKRE